MSNGEGSNDNICWGMAWHADGKLEVAFDCDAIFSEELQGDTDTEWIFSDLDVDVWFWLVSGN